MEPQSLAVKRAEVEFHNFASLGEPERVLKVYAEENERRGGFLREHAGFIGSLTPFLEIGANAGHSSYMLTNQFGAEGFALDLSADALRYGVVLQEVWGMPKAPVRLAGDAAKLPFRDGSLRLVLAFQMLSQFMDIESVFLEVKRVLAPGGIFVFAEEPLRRRLSLRLYRCPYYETMKPWERKLFDWGLLGYLVRDVIGAHQEESFGIRQNHTMGLKDWDRLVRKHFAAREYALIVPERGWGERIVKRMALRIDRYGSPWQAAKLLGGTLSAACRKDGDPPPSYPSLDAFEQYLRCPDCLSGALARDSAGNLACPCGFAAPLRDSVYNLLPTTERKELYPENRDDLIDFTQPDHARLLGEGWGELEGVYGNKYRWIGARATARLKKMGAGRQKIRIRGFAQENWFEHGQPRIEAIVNGARAGRWNLDRAGLFVLEAGLPETAEYNLEIQASPTWKAPGDSRTLSVNLSMIRLVPLD